MENTPLTNFVISARPKKRPSRNTYLIEVLESEAVWRNPKNPKRMILELTPKSMSRFRDELNDLFAK